MGRSLSKKKVGKKPVDRTAIAKTVAAAAQISISPIQIIASIAPDILTQGAVYTTNPHPHLNPPTATFESLPSEIVFMIAEHCIEPFDIRVVRITRSDGIIKRIVEGPNGVQLSLVSRLFNIGIKQGLINKFSGHLDLARHTHVDFNIQVMAKKEQAWLRDLVTTITIRAAIQGPPKFPYASYTKLRKVELIFGRQDGVTSQADADSVVKDIRLPGRQQKHTCDLSLATLPDITLIGYFPYSGTTEVADLTALPAKILPSLNYMKK
ncbi:hypothetical protein H2198_006826 [Neophaeococcomyces mojaviensis]|uniref:Uncharacterized protein n=1 Tax=Neophaeococcomyces mojaviensis TaxID=3383035 RepID=A0ACC3A1X6_9EURO|nr:hypothetical protein H2198_006826 [Knufia sp. JES_112]